MVLPGAGPCFTQPSRGHGAHLLVSSVDCCLALGVACGSPKQRKLTLIIAVSSSLCVRTFACSAFMRKCNGFSAFVIHPGLGQGRGVFCRCPADTSAPQPQPRAERVRGREREERRRERGRKGEREGERQGKRDTEIQRDRETEKQRDSETGRDRRRQGETERTREKH